MKTLFRGLLGAISLSTAAVNAQVTDCSDWNPGCFPYGLNPPLTCPTWGCCNWEAGLEYIFWKPFVENMHAAQVLKAKNYSVTDQFADGFLVNKPKDYRFNWESGFRVTLGYSFPCDKWGLESVWTHYKTDVKSKLTGVGTFSGSQEIEIACIPAPSFITGEYLRPFLWANKGELFGKWHFQLNQVDLNFFRDFYVGHSLSLRPYAGLRLIFLQNHISTCGDWIISQESGLHFEEISGTQRLKSDFKGLGLKGGLDTHWEMCGGLNVYGNFGLAAVYTDVDTDNQTVVVANPNLSTISKLTNEIPYEFQVLKVFTDFAIGIQWRETFNCNQNLFSFKFGWEHHVIFSGSDLKSLNNDMLLVEQSLVPTGTRFLNSDGNITFYGFVCSAGVFF